MKESVEKLEGLVAGWLKPLPRLPESFKKWVSVNLWWIDLIGAIVSGIALLVAIGGLITIVSMLSGIHSIFGYYYSVYSGWNVFASIVSLAFIVCTITITAIAISPLKLGKKKGWTLLFYVLLIEAVAVVVNSILTFSVLSFIFGIIFGAIGIAIGTYLLFEIRSEFGEGFSKAEIKAEEKAEEKK